MSILSNFVKATNIDKKPFITVYSKIITFSKVAADLLNNPKYINLYQDKKNHKVAIKPCDDNDNDAISFYEIPKEGKQVLIRWTSKDKMKLITDIIENQKYEEGSKYYGTFYPEENVIIFDLNN